METLSRQPHAPADRLRDAPVLLRARDGARGPGLPDQSAGGRRADPRRCRRSRNAWLPPELQERFDYADYGAVHAAFLLGRLLGSRGRPQALERARLGGHLEQQHHLPRQAEPESEHPLLARRELDFVETEHGAAIRNLHPLPGEPELYRMAATHGAGEKYGLITVLPGPQPGRRMMILSSSAAELMWALAESGRPARRASRRSCPASFCRRANVPPAFQVVIAATFESNVPVKHPLRDPPRVQDALKCANPSTHRSGYPHPVTVSEPFGVRWSPLFGGRRRALVFDENGAAFPAACVLSALTALSACSPGESGARRYRGIGHRHRGIGWHRECHGRRQPAPRERPAARALAAAPARPGPAARPATPPADPEAARRGSGRGDRRDGRERRQRRDGAAAAAQRAAAAPAAAREPAARRHAAGRGGTGGSVGTGGGGSAAGSGGTSGSRRERDRRGPAAVLRQGEHGRGLPGAARAARVQRAPDGREPARPVLDEQRHPHQHEGPVAMPARRHHGADAVLGIGAEGRASQHPDRHPVG